jgi:hypothetical protein
MNGIWRKTSAALLIASLALSGAGAAMAADDDAAADDTMIEAASDAAPATTADAEAAVEPAEESAPQAAVVWEAPSGALTDSIEAQLVSLLNQHSSDGSQLAAVVKLINQTDDTVRVPDYIVRVVTENGASYTLRASGSNAKAIQPQSSVQLSYLIQVDRQDILSITDVIWVDVNKDVYPKVETTMLDLPAGNMVWTGDDGQIGNPDAILNWGVPFTIPYSDSPLEFTPVSLLTDNQSAAPVKVVEFLVHNPGPRTENVPDFTLNGKSGAQVYPGTRVDKGFTSLNPDESKYMNYAIPIDLDVAVTNMDLLTPESFVSTDPAVRNPQMTYSVGRLNIGLPDTDMLPAGRIASINDGKTPIKLDPLNDVFRPDLTVTAADAQLFENKGEGYQTAIVKFLLTNNGEKPLAVPKFGSDLVDGNGLVFLGSRIPAQTLTIQPHTSFVADYAYVLPLSAGGQFTLRVLDSQTAAPYNAVIGGTLVNIGKVEQIGKGTMSLYPYTLDLSDWQLSYSPGINPLTGMYQYKFKLDATWQMNSIDSVVTDTGASRLQLVIENQDGEELSNQLLDLSGAERLHNGSQTVYFASGFDHLDLPLSLKLYEAIDTPNGKARHLLTTLQP